MYLTSKCSVRYYIKTEDVKPASPTAAASATGGGADSDSDFDAVKRAAAAPLPLISRLSDSDDDATRRRRFPAVVPRHVSTDSDSDHREPIVSTHSYHLSRRNARGADIFHGIYKIFSNIRNLCILFLCTVFCPQKCTCT